MKLLTKTTIYFLLAMVPLLAGAGIFLFQQFSKEINKRVDKELVHEEIQWIRYIETITANGSAFVLRSPDILIHPVRKEVMPYPQITNTVDYMAGENRRVPFRQLMHVVPVNGVAYQIVIRRSQEQKTELVANVTWIMLLVFVGLFMATLLFNWFISKRLWRPFRASLEKIRRAELQKMEAVRFEETNIEEFNELNASLNYMADKISNDYVTMKEFTENAAHEMQTPLAVVQSKLELLLQDANLSEKQVETILQASTALSRLSKLNQSLLLLAKIENHQYETNEPINLKETVVKYLQLFDELIKDKGISIEKKLEENFVVPLHPLLADSLVSNLLGNALKYNKEGGRIFIATTNASLQISNTSSLPPIEKQQLFKRFHKGAEHSGSSTGLGLAIVKRIADTHQLQINYKSEGGMHHFVVEKR